MKSLDVFALKNSGVNAFLFADVGIELNGSMLTTLSVLARLGQDPWAEAARLARLPKPAAADCLVQSIIRMPLGPQALADVRKTASRLVQLLPSQVRTTGQSASAVIGLPAWVPSWLPVVFLCSALTFGFAVHMLMAPRSPAAVETPTEQTLDHTD
jgi:hypothetical protein